MANLKFVKILAKLESVTVDEMITMMETAYVESNAGVREKLVEAGYKEYDY
jgi:hypothetical protein